MKGQLPKLILVSIIMLGLTALTSCKKGENDPVLSLKTRKARITGEWKLVAGRTVETETFGGSTGVLEIEYDETSYSEVGESWSTEYTETIEFKRNGTYEQTKVQNGSKVIIKGNWYFAGANDEMDLKKKEAIILSETEHVHQNGTTTYGGLHADQTLIIDRLKNKEMVIKGEITSDFNGPDPESYSYSYDFTYEKQ